MNVETATTEELVQEMRELTEGAKADTKLVDEHKEALNRLRAAHEVRVIRLQSVIEELTKRAAR